jgi:SAM-dependent methyltransferase
VRRFRHFLAKHRRVLVAAFLFVGVVHAQPAAPPSSGVRGVDATSAPAAPARAPDVPYQPSPPEVVEAMLDLAGVGPRDVVYDLGSGDGRIVIAAARRGVARAVGIDIDPLLVAEAQANARAAGVAGRATFVQGDIFDSDFGDATVVTLFLWPGVNLKLRPRLLALPPGTRVISHMHDMGDWKPERTVRVPMITGAVRERVLYLWVVPAR